MGVPFPREFVEHAHLIVRHLKLLNAPSESRVAMDSMGLLAELRDIRCFFETALATRLSAEPPATDEGHPLAGLLALKDGLSKNETVLVESIIKHAAQRAIVLRRQRRRDQRRAVQRMCRIRLRVGRRQKLSRLLRADAELRASWPFGYPAVP